MNVMADETQLMEVTSLSDVFIDDVANEVEVVTSEQPQRANDAQLMELGAFVEARAENTEVERAEIEVSGRRCLNELQLKFVDSLHKITGYLTPEGKFVPNTVLRIDGDVWFFGYKQIQAEIFVRESYVELADLILADFETVNKHQRNGVILGGTPGVGKSTFLAFLLCCCYVRRKFKPQLFGEILLSIDKGNPVRLHWDETRGQYVCWPFRDGNNWIYLFDVVESSSAPGNSDAYVVAACSPSANYSSFSKLQVYRLYMPVWSEAELLTCQSQCDKITIEPGTMKQLYNMVGGIARLVLLTGEFDDVKMKALKRYMEEGYGKYSIKDVMDAVDGSKTPHIAHRLIHIEPTENYTSYKYIFGSPKIELEYLTQKMKLGLDQVLEYASLLTNPHAQSMRGFIFEQVAHCLFYPGSCVLPVKQLLQREPVTAQLKWRFVVSNAKLIDGNRIKDDLQDGEYGVGTRNLSGIDGVLQPDTLFQMTVSREHKINLPGLVNALMQMNETRRKIKFLFVVPKDVYAQFPYQNFDRKAPSANHKFCLAANQTIREMENYVKERVLYGVVCVDLDDTNVRIKARDAFSRCNTDLLTLRRRDIDA